MLRDAKEVASGVLLAAEMTPNDDHDFAADVIRARDREVIEEAKRIVLNTELWDGDSPMAIADIRNTLLAALDRIMEEK